MAPKPATDPAKMEKRCYLLELPGELRMQIYEYVLMPDSVTLHSSDRPIVTGFSAREVVASRFIRDQAESVLQPEILRTRRQIHQEAKLLPYSPRSLILWPTSCHDYQHLPAASRPVDVTKFSRVHTIPHLIVHVYTTTYGWVEERLHSKALTETWSRGCKVKRFELKIHDGLEYDQEVLWQTQSVEHKVEEWMEAVTSDIVTVSLSHIYGGPEMGRWCRSELASGRNRSTSPPCPMASLQACPRLFR